MYPTEEGQSLAEYSLQKFLPCFLFKSKLCVSWQNAGQAAVCDRPIYIRDAQIFNVGCIAWRPTSPRHWSREIFPFLVQAFLDLGPWCGVAVTLLVQIRHATADFIAVQSLPGFIAMECNMSCGYAVKVHQAMFLYRTAQNKDILAQLHRLNNRQSWWGKGHQKSWGKWIKEHFATKLSRYLSDKGSLLNSVLHEEWIFKAKVQKSKEKGAHEK